MHKLCLKCKLTFPIEQFHRSKNTRDGHRTICSLCMKKYRELNSDKIKISDKRHYEKNLERYSLSNKKYRRSNSDKLREQRLLKSYNLSIQEYDEMFLLQKGECKICNTTSTKPLSVDHCHSTGKIRGLLCNPCNMGIGQFKDSIVRLKNAISYLEGSDDQIKS